MTRPVCGSVLAVAFVLAIVPGHAVAQNARNPRLVAIFAHPDDESAAGCCWRDMPVRAWT